MRALLVAVLAALLTLTACGTATGPQDSGSSAEERATTGGDDADAPVASNLEFSAETVSGEPFDGASLAGRPTVFWFWAPWCPTCRGQISGVGELAKRFAGQVEVVGVGGLDEKSAIQDFASQVSDEVTLLSDADGQVWRHFGVTAQSTYLVLDEDGATLASGYLDDDELVDVVDEMVG